MAWIAQEEEGTGLTLDSVQVVVHSLQKNFHAVDGRMDNLFMFVVLDGTGFDARQPGKIRRTKAGFFPDFSQDRCPVVICEYHYIYQCLTWSSVSNSSRMSS